MKKSPFKISNQGEKIDDAFFVRLIRFEKYYENLAKKDEANQLMFNTLKQINSILQRELLSIEDVRKAIDLFNQLNQKTSTDKTWWLDLRLHLRHLAFVYGKEFETDKDFNLIEKE